MGSTLREDLERVLNTHSAENGSDTPDFMLAEFLLDCLAAYDKTVTARERWYGRGAEMVSGGTDTAPAAGPPSSQPR